MGRRAVLRGALASVALLVALAAGAGGGSPARAQDGATESMCLLTLDEMRELTGLPFASTAEARGACTYASDPDADMFALDLRLDPEASLDSVRFLYDRGGMETTIAGYPAWASDDGLFVDLGGRALAVQPIFFLADTPLDPAAIQAAVAELAVPRVDLAEDAIFGAEDRLGSMFPAELAGQPVYVEVMAGDEFLRFVDLGTSEIEGILADHALSTADMLVGTAFVGDEAEVIALQAPGLDAALLAPPVGSALAGSGADPDSETRASKELLAFPASGTWLYASDDVLWIVRTMDDSTLEAILKALP